MSDDDKMVEPGPNAYTSAMWFMGNEYLDWMFMLFKNKGENFFRANYRFRYHKDDKIFDSDDEKHWYSIVYKEDAIEDDLILKTHVVAKQLGVMLELEPEYVPIKSDAPDALYEALKDKPWAHMRKLEKGSEEAKKYGLE